MTTKEELIYANEEIKALKEQLEAAKAAILLSLIQQKKKSENR